MKDRFPAGDPAPVVRHHRELINGWGRTCRLSADVATPESPAGLSELVADSPRIVARGLGRSYGDQAQLSGGAAVQLSGIARITSLDPATGVVDVEAGASLDHLMRVLAPRGWFVPVTPGTRFVTVGGAIASDIHGKNHHRDGTFGRHVQDLTLMLADGSTVTVSPQVDPELFWATVGGMGLTGVIVSARVQLQPIESTKIRSVSVRASNLDSLMTAMERADENNRYAVAWVDSLAKGRHFGRGILTSGDHATAAEVGQCPDRWAFDSGDPVNLPIDLPPGTLNRLTVKAFNELWFRQVPRFARPRLESIPAFFHPLDAIGRWNRVYGSAGFVQYQFVVPDRGAHLVGRTISAIARIGGVSLVTVLKRFGPSNSAHLSFPQPGWTLALDIPARLDGLAETLDHLDEQVVAAGGRLYLTKDARMRPALLPLMYPRIDEWRTIRNRVDPNRKFNSDMAIRLGM